MRVTKAEMKRLGVTLLPDSGCPGPWLITLAGYSFPSTNQLLRSHWAKRGRIKRAAAAEVLQACRAAGVPAATGPRSVRIVAAVANMGQAPDGDNLLKVALDSLVSAGALLDDDAAYCRASMPEVVKSTAKGTLIYLDDIREQPR